MKDVLSRWNRLPFGAAVKEILPCCGSRAWASGMVMCRPVPDKTALLAVSDEVWRGLAGEDWMEAFRSHPRIGESQPSSTQHSRWSTQEQQKVTADGDAVKIALAEANKEYEQRFNQTFIVCATGRSGPEILEILRRRLHNDQATELQEAAEQQRRITRIRLEKWLSE